METIRVDIRFIVATNQDLEEAISNGKFREDLYYRLNVVSITIPPLRERKEDITDLVSYFSKKDGKSERWRRNWARRTLRTSSTRCSKNSQIPLEPHKL